jgi:ribokinase
MPGSGESVVGTAFTTAPGGKAANQACQLTRCGIETILVGKIGDDPFGKELRAALESAGIDTRFLLVDPNTPTGASTVLTAGGDYTSIIVPGAAALLSETDVDSVIASVRNPAALVMQFEIPSEISTYAAQVASSLGAQIVVNASPVPDDPESIPARLWRYVDLLIVNRAEAERYAGEAGRGAPPDALARTLSTMFGVESVVVTMGGDGAAMFADGTTRRQPAYPALLVDSIGAGDAFLGSLVASYVTDSSREVAMRRAAAAGALAVSGHGAIPSIPTAYQIDELLRGS